MSSVILKKHKKTFSRLSCAIACKGAILKSQTKRRDKQCTTSSAITSKTLALINASAMIRALHLPRIRQGRKRQPNTNVQRARLQTMAATLYLLRQLIDSKALISAFLFAAFGCTYARRHFTKWHLVGDSVGLQGQKIMNQWPQLDRVVFFVYSRIHALTV